MAEADIAHDPEIDTILDWFKTKGCTLWGTYFSITDPKRAVDAAEWFQAELASYHEYASQGSPEAKPADPDSPINDAIVE